MPYTDLPPGHPAARDELPAEPEDFDAFWRETLRLCREAGGSPGLHPVPDSPLATLDAYDVRFPGWGGQPVAAWLLVPSEAEGPLPAVITYIGYTGGRGLPTDHLLFASAGYAHLVVDSRGQGHDTPDPHPDTGTQWVHGFTTRGIQYPRDHYFRRLVADLAVHRTRRLPAPPHPGRPRPGLRHPRPLRRRPLRPPGHGPRPLQRRPDGPGLPAVHRPRGLPAVRG